MNDRIAEDLSDQRQKDEAQTHFLQADTATSSSHSGCGTVTRPTEADDKGGCDFISAAKTGNIQSLIHLIHEIDKIDEKEEILDTAFHAALCQGHIECAKKLVEFGANLNARDSNGRTALCTAAIKGQVTCVRTLLEAGARFDLEDTHDKTSLCLAASNGYFDCVIELMYLSYQHKVYRFLSSETQRMYLRTHSTGDSEERESKACLCLCMASGLGQTDCLAALINTGLDVNMILRIGNEPRPIYFAAVHGHLECLTLLLNAGAEVNTSGEEDFSPLTFALSGQNIDCVKALVEAGAEVNAQRPYRGIANPDFFDAVIYGDVHCLNLMIEAGADVNAKDARGMTCLFFAAAGSKLACVEALIKEGANVNVRDFHGETAIRRASKAEEKADRPLCVEALIRAGANIYVRCWEQDNPALPRSMRERCSYMSDEVMVNDLSTPAIVTAAWKGQSQQVAWLLLEKGVSVNVQGEDGTTALMAASWEGHIQCLDILLSVIGININAKDYHGRTALYAATCGDHMECMKKILLHEGGGLDVENAMVSAVRNAKVECSKTLLEYLPDAETSLSVMERILLARGTKCVEACMLPLLRAGIFHWEWYGVGMGRFGKRVMPSLTRELVIHGYAPGLFDFDDEPCSPLMYAFRVGDCALVRYLLANLYLTPYDLSHFQKDTALSNHVYDKGSVEIQMLHQQLVCAPWRLEVLSILRVFNMLKNYGCRQEEAVRRSELAHYLPNKFLKTLSFCNPIRYLCMNEWAEIEWNSPSFKISVWPGDDNMVEKKSCDACVTQCKTIVDKGIDQKC